MERLYNQSIGSPIIADDIKAPVALLRDFVVDCEKGKIVALVVNKRLTYDIAFDYSDKNRDVLKEYKTAKEINDYLEAQKIFDQFVRYAEQKGVPGNTKGVDVSKRIINTQIKAYIARNIIDNEGFYPIIMEIDNAFNKAIEFFATN